MNFAELFNSNYSFDILGTKVNVDLRSERKKNLDNFSASVREACDDMAGSLRRKLHANGIDRINKLVVSQEVRAEIMQAIAGRDIFNIFILPSFRYRGMDEISISLSPEPYDLDPTTLTFYIPKQPR